MRNPSLHFVVAFLDLTQMQDTVTYILSSTIRIQNQNHEDKMSA